MSKQNGVRRTQNFGEVKLQGEQARMKNSSRSESRVRVRRTKGAMDNKRKRDIWNKG